jgi:uncharacterized repeat protein (TIGR02543 family)
VRRGKKRVLQKLKSRITRVISGKRQRALVFIGLFGVVGASLLALGFAVPEFSNSRGGVPANDLEKGLIYDGLEVAEIDECGAKGLFKVKDVTMKNEKGEDVPACTHGPDPIPEERKGKKFESASDYYDPVSDAYKFLGSGYSDDSPTASLKNCGTDGNRIRPLYFYTNNDRFGSYSMLFQQVAQKVQWRVSASAQRSGGPDRYLRFYTDGSCVLDIARHKINVDDAKSYSALIQKARSFGYNQGGQSYMIWVDTQGASGMPCGVGTLGQPSTTGQSASNVHTAAWDKCWNYAEGHELFHNFGAVPNSAPNTSGGGHCIDDYESMCYNDNADGQLKTTANGKSVQIVCADTTKKWLFDCNHNDYFSTNPPAGSYLATSWNAANSIFFSPGQTIVTTPPPAEQTPNASGQIEAYRLYSTKGKGYTYSHSRVEVYNLTANSPWGSSCGSFCEWTYEAPVWRVYPKGSSGTPIYRLRHKQNGYYYHTTNLAEVQNKTAEVANSTCAKNNSCEYVYIAWPFNVGGGSSPVWRLRSYFGPYLFSSNSEEAKHLAANFPGSYCNQPGHAPCIWNLEGWVFDIPASTYSYNAPSQSISYQTPSTSNTYNGSCSPPSGYTSAVCFRINGPTSAKFYTTNHSFGTCNSTIVSTNPTTFNDFTVSNNGACSGAKFGPPDGLTLYPRPITGWTFTGFTVTEAPSSGTLTCNSTSCNVNFGDGTNKIAAVITANYTATTSTPPVSLTINVNAPTPNGGGYNGGPVTFTATPHTLGYCLSSITITPNSGGSGTTTCSSAADYGIGSPSGTNVVAPSIKGYTFTGWSGSSWSGTKCTYATTDRCVNILPGGTNGTITANYKPNQAVLAVNVYPAISAPMTSVNHTIGDCYSSFTAAKTCYSAPGYPIGLAPDGLVTYVRAGAVTGYKFIGWSGACSGTGDCPVGIAAGQSMSITANYQKLDSANLTIYVSGAPSTVYLTSSPHTIGYCNPSGGSFAISSGTTRTCTSAPGYGIGIPDGTNIIAPSFSNYTLRWSGSAEFTSATSCSRASNALCANMQPGQSASVTLSYSYVAPPPSCTPYTYSSALCINVTGNGGSSLAYTTQHTAGTCYGMTSKFYIPTKCEGNSFGTYDGMYLYADNPYGTFRYWSIEKYPSNGSNGLYCYSTWCYLNYGSYNTAIIRAVYY